MLRNRHLRMRSRFTTRTSRSVCGFGHLARLGDIISHLVDLSILCFSVLPGMGLSLFMSQYMAYLVLTFPFESSIEVESNVGFDLGGRYTHDFRARI